MRMCEQRADRVPQWATYTDHLELAKMVQGVMLFLQSVNRHINQFANQHQ